VCACLYIEEKESEKKVEMKREKKKQLEQLIYFTFSPVYIIPSRRSTEDIVNDLLFNGCLGYNCLADVVNKRASRTAKATTPIWSRLD